MLLKNGKRSVVFKVGFAAPYDNINPGEVHGYPDAEAQLILAAKRPNNQPGEAAVDYIPTTLKEAQGLEQLVKDDLLDAKDADAVVDALGKAEVLSPTAVATLKKAHAAAQATRDAPPDVSAIDRQGIATLLSELGHRRAAADVAGGVSDDEQAAATKANPKK